MFSVCFFRHNNESDLLDPCESDEYSALLCNKENTACGSGSWCIPGPGLLFKDYSMNFAVAYKYNQACSATDFVTEASDIGKAFFYVSR